MKPKKTNTAKTIKEARWLNGLEEILSGDYPNSFAEAYIEGMSDGLNEPEAAKYAMVAHRGDA